jgi:hypothetical protein
MILNNTMGNVPVNLAHIFFTGPLLIYVGLLQPDHAWVYHVLLGLGVSLGIYFLYMIFTRSLSQYHVWLMVHLALFFPLLIWVGLKKKEAPRVIFSLILAIGCAAVGYHSIRLVQSLTG